MSTSANSKLPDRLRARALKVVDRQVARETVLAAIGQAVSMVRAQPYLGLVAGYMAVDVLDRSHLIRDRDADVLKTMALVVAAAPAGGGGVAAALGLGFLASIGSGGIRSEFDARLGRPVLPSLFPDLRSPTEELLSGAIDRIRSPAKWLSPPF